MQTALTLLVTTWHKDALFQIMGVVLILVSLLLILLVLVQDTKAGGLGTAFGGGTGEALLGARGQKDIARVTAILSAVFLLLAIGMGVYGNSLQRRSIVEEQPVELEAKEAPPAEKATGPEDEPAGQDEKG